MSKTGWGNNNNSTVSSTSAAAVPPPLSSSSGACDGGDGSSSGGGHQNIQTRTLLVTISGNRATWNHLHMHGAVWQVNQDQAASIFADAPPSAVAGGGLAAMDAGVAAIDMGALTDRLSRAMIRKVTVVESNTNIDEPVAVHIDGLPSAEFTRNGEGASLFLTGEGRVLQPQEIFSISGNSELGLQWMRQFPRYTNENLETEGTMLLTGASYYFVHQDHPVIHFLKANEERFGILCFQEPSLEGGWLRIDVDAFQFTVRSIRDTILKNTPSTFNLNTLTVRITKPDAQPWLHLSPQFINSLLPDEVRESNNPDLISDARQLGIQRYLDRPLFATLRLRIEYALPEASVSPAPMAGLIPIASSGGPTPLITNNNIGGGAGPATGGGGGLNPTQGMRKG